VTPGSCYGRGIARCCAFSLGRRLRVLSIENTLAIYWFPWSAQEGASYFRNLCRLRALPIVQIEGGWGALLLWEARSSSFLAVQGGLGQSASEYFPHGSARLGILALNRNSSIAAMSSACKWTCRRLVRVSFPDDTGFLPSLAQPPGGDQQWLGIRLRRSRYGESRRFVFPYRLVLRISGKPCLKDSAQVGIDAVGKKIEQYCRQLRRPIWEGSYGVV
jgi:hypothetical protein